MAELLLGCGSKRDKRITVSGNAAWTDLITLDFNADHKPDVVHDLNTLPLPFPDNSFDEIHAYEVLEHIGQQGDFRTFFAQFSEFWRILKPDGVLAATVPSFKSMWAWGDPSHTRVINQGSLIFLDQDEYARQVGVTAMSDFRFCYTADFARIYANDDGETFSFVLKARKGRG